MYLGVTTVLHRVQWEGLVTLSVELSLLVVSSMVVGTGFCPIIITTHVTHSHMT